MPPNGSGAPAPHWRLAALPGSGDILLTNPDQKNQVAQTIASLNSTRTACGGMFYLDGFSKEPNCSLITALKTLVAFGGPLPYLAPPAASAATSPVTVTLLGVWIGKAAPVVDSLCIVAATGSYQTQNCADPDPTATTVTLGTLAPAYNLGTLPPQLAAILIRVRAEDASAAAVSQLQRVAVNAFEIARSVALPGAPLPQGAALKIEQSILKAYTIADSNWPIPKTDFGIAPQGSGYLLMVENLRLVGSAAIILTRGTEAVQQSQKTEDALASRRLAVSCDLAKQYQKELASIVNVIPTSDQAWAVAQAIDRSVQLTKPVIPQPASADFKPCPGAPVPSAAAANRMEFTAARRAVVGTLDGTVNAGISASPHEILSGTGQLSENHVLLQDSETWADTGSLNVNGGVEVQNANASFGIGRSVGVRQTLDFGFDVDGLYLRDQNQRYGYLAGPKFVDEEYGANPNIYATWTRPGTLYALSAVVKASLGEQFRHVSVEPPSTYPPFLTHCCLNHGWVNGFDPTLSAVIGYDFAHSRPPTATGGGLGQILVSITANYLAARASSWGDFNFDRYSLKAEAEVFFGVTGTSDFFARYGRGVSAASAGTPFFELPQVGGADNIRGIEQGEYVGRGLGFDRSEFAVNAVSAWKWVRRKPAAASAKADPANTSLGGLGITGIFIGGIYDRARIGANSGPSNLFDLTHGFHSAGVEAEVRGLPAGQHRVNINFAYSISPNSVLHRDGVFITSVSLDF